MSRFDDRIIIDAPPAVAAAIRHRIITECATPEPLYRRGSAWVPPADPPGWEGLVPQNDREWREFARCMFPRWSDRTAAASIGAWKKRVFDSPSWWALWPQRPGWAAWRQFKTGRSL